MKNIERPEVQLPFIKLISDAEYTSYDFYKDLPSLGMPKSKEKVIEWLNSEYVGPHHWEQWELEALSHINKNLTTITKDSNACQFMNFPSMKEKEIINIDEELERNGMHR